MVFSYKRSLLNSILKSREGKILEDEVLSLLTLMLETDFGLINRIEMSRSNEFALYSYNDRDYIFLSTFAPCS